MKRIPLLMALFALAATLFSCSNGGQQGGYAIDSQKVKLNNLGDSLSWVLGEQLAMQFAKSMQAANMPLNNQVVEQAFCNALEGVKSPIEPAASERLYMGYQMISAQNVREGNQNRQAQAESQETEFFKKLVAENPKVKRHETGFYYEVVRQGKGRNCKYGDRISFDYKGYLMPDEKLFDQTYGQRDPIIHVVGKPMFQGLLDGLQLMNAGSIYKLYIPNRLAFGAQGTEHIPPYTGVIYEVELHEIFDN